jgi:PAS domain S-box-containing protein
MNRSKTKSAPSSSKSSQPANFYPDILESIAEGIVVISPDRKIIFVNKMAKELVGIRDEHPEGRSCFEVIRTDLCSDGCPFDLKNVDSSCTSYLMNIKLYKENDSSIPLCLNVAPMHNSDGELVGIIENFRPMSEAIKVIESLKKSNVILAQEKDKVDSIIESLADGVFTVDSELRITSFSKGMENLTGLKESEVIGSTCEEVLSADNCESGCPFANTLKNGYGLANIAERIVMKNGDTLPVFISTAFLKDSSDGDIELIATVRDASEIEKLKKEVNDRYQFSNIIGKSSQMQQIFELIETLADTDCAILIGGESGTGKELVSRAIHHESGRRNRPFIKVNCSAIVEGLFESELFGHVKGAFTGAIKDKVGKFELADGGTIFLDEIADMPLSLQPKLLRVLQDMEFERVGDNKTRKVDVRIIAATNKNLKDEIRAKRFREDLYYRLCVVPIEMPSLRERREDIPLLINHFIEKCNIKIHNRPNITEVTPQALSALLDYDWPGNVRELENAIEHACIRSKTDRIDRDSLPVSIIGMPAARISEPVTHDISETISEIQKKHIDELMKQYNGNKSKVAKNLGISRTTLWRRLREMS